MTTPSASEGSEGSRAPQGEASWWSTAPSAEPGQLYVLATPIGNLGDLSRRVAAVLATADILAAEDTRVTRKLTSHLGVPGAARLTSCHDHNERHRAPWLVQQLQNGRSVALVSDAGTPLLSDPGLPVIQAALDAGIPVVPVPGPSALLPALVLSGLPTDRFSFQGFLPSKAKARRQRLQELVQRPETQVFYETSQRLLKALRDLVEVFGPRRQASLSRDLTKQGELSLRGSLTELLAELSDPERDLLWGEWVMVVEGESVRPAAAHPSDGSAPDSELAGPSSAAWVQAERLIRALRAEGIPTRRIRDIVSAHHDLPKRDVYQRVLALQSESPG